MKVFLKLLIPENLKLQNILSSKYLTFLSAMEYIFKHYWLFVLSWVYRWRYYGLDEYCRICSSKVQLLLHVNTDIRKSSWILVKNMYLIQKNQNILENFLSTDMKRFIQGQLLNYFSETKTVIFMRKVISLRCFPRNKWQGTKLMVRGKSSFTRQFLWKIYARKLSITYKL